MLLFQVFIPLFPLNTIKFPNRLPHNTRSAVSATPWYCPPKNNAVDTSSERKYIIPDDKHITNLLLFIFPAVTIAPIHEDRTRITNTAYPALFQSIIPFSIIFAAITAPINVVPTDERPPQSSPAGVDDAVPVCLRFTFIRHSPFPIPYWI